MTQRDKLNEAVLTNDKWTVRAIALSVRPDLVLKVSKQYIRGLILESERDDRFFSIAARFTA